MNQPNNYAQLLSLYSGIMDDMKRSYGAWDVVGQRATKLATALRTTSSALLSFLDAIQAVSDIANNLKGASRDVSACVTRICMRERAVEARLREVAEKLSDQVAPNLLQRMNHWKSRTYDLEKSNAKQVKKIKGKAPDASSIINQKAACGRALLEQRIQFEFFIQTLMPFLNSEVACIEEATHMVTAVNGLATQMKQSNPTHLVQTVLADLIDEDGSKVSRVLEECHQQSGLRGSSEDPSPTWSVTTSGSADSVDKSANVSMGAPISTTPYFYVPVTSNDHPSLRSLSRKSSHHSVISKNMSICDGSPIAFRHSNEILKQRPQSFSGQLQSKNDDSYQWSNDSMVSNNAAYATINGYAESNRCQPLTPNTSFDSTNCYSKPKNFGYPVHPDSIKDGPYSSSDAASTAFIADTLQQIDRLGTDLNTLYSDTGSYADLDHKFQPPLPRPTHLPPPPAYNNSIRLRQNQARGRPPPPERRGSQLSVGTPATPSVTRSSFLGSQNSLNSSALSTFDRSETQITNDSSSSSQYKYTF